MRLAGGELVDWGELKRVFWLLGIGCPGGVRVAVLVWGLLGLDVIGCIEKGRLDVEMIGGSFDSNAFSSQRALRLGICQGVLAMMLERNDYALNCSPFGLHGREVVQGIAKDMKHHNENTEES